MEYGVIGFLKGFFAGGRIGKVRIVPISLKVAVLFFILLSASNFISNYLNLLLNQREHVRLRRILMVRDLERVLVFSSEQFQKEILAFNQSRAVSLENVQGHARLYLTKENALFLGVSDNGQIHFLAGPENEPRSFFSDSECLQRMKETKNKGGALTFTLFDRLYYGVYKYNSLLDMHFIRAEVYTDFTATSQSIFTNVLLLITVLTIFCAIIGIYSIHYLLRYIKILTSSLHSIQESKQLRLIDIQGAANDDITYLATTFNALSTKVERLVTTFKCFVARDVARQAYEGVIPRGGQRRDLVVLFTDIPQFSRMTEILGPDVITLLNAHYKQVINAIHSWEGDINSIIGDALLAIFGLFGSNSDATENQHGFAALKYHQSISAAFAIQRCISPLLKKIHMNIGIGIDGGEVFYGTIGAPSRMTNTVIGDQVNFASRLEGLTRWYQVPIICSDIVRRNAEEYFNHDFYFLELDTVIVHGKTTEQKVYWVMEKQQMDDELKQQVMIFTHGLHLYYGGQWSDAKKIFAACTLPPKDVFIRRIATMEIPPKNWNGVWIMKTK